MQLTLSETQSMLQDTANRLLRDRHSFEQRKKILAGQGESLWNAFAELGLLGIEIGEDCGGAAGSFADLAVVLEAMGRHLGTGDIYAVKYLLSWRSWLAARAR